MASPTSRSQGPPPPLVESRRDDATVGTTTGRRQNLSDPSPYGQLKPVTPVNLSTQLTDGPADDGNDR